MPNDNSFRNHLRDQDPLEDPVFRQLLPTRLLESFESTPSSRRTLRQDGSTKEERFFEVLNENVPTDAPKRIPATKLGGPKNMPLFILRQFQALLNDFHTTSAPSVGSPSPESPILDNATWANCLNVCKEMTDQLSQAERIRDTPIPMALGIHVSVCSKYIILNTSSSDIDSAANAGSLLPEYTTTNGWRLGNLGCSSICHCVGPVERGHKTSGNR